MLASVSAPSARYCQGRAGMARGGKAWFDPSRQREISESIAARRARLLPERKALQARLLTKWRAK